MISNDFTGRTSATNETRILFFSFVGQSIFIIRFFALCRSPKWAQKLHRNERAIGTLFVVSLVLFMPRRRTHYYYSYLFLLPCSLNAIVELCECIVPVLVSIHSLFVQREITIALRPFSQQTKNRKQEQQSEPGKENQNMKSISRTCALDSLWDGKGLVSVSARFSALSH